MKLFLIIALLTLSVATMGDKQENRGGPKRYRVSGILYFLSFDGFRVDILEILSYLKTCTVGEFLRKADRFFTNSELKGKVSIKLPDGQENTILEMKEYTEFSYAQPYYFSYEYEGSKETSFEMSCDLEEIDSSPYENNQVCFGSQLYQAQSSIFGQNSNDAIKDLKEASKGNGKNIDFVDIAHQAGYEKLLNNEGSKNLKEAIERIAKFKEDLAEAGKDLIKITAAVKSALYGISGVYLINLNIEKAEKGSGTYKRVEDSWVVADAKSVESKNEKNGEFEKFSSDATFQELYGQLYLLPQASTLNIEDILFALGKEIPEKFEYFLSDFEIPFLNGPAFPLFDLPRLSQKENGFEIQESSQNKFSAYFKNKEDKKYIVFANLWETDGDATAFQFDDCFVKGSIFGLERVDFGGSDTFRFPRCDNNEQYHAMMHRNSPITIDDDDSKLVEYHLSGSFSIYCSQDGGGYYEPYGGFKISVGGRKINQNFVVWKVEKNDYIYVMNKKSYVQPFTIRFRESVKFLEPDNYITLHGGVWEYDNSGDQLIGKFEDRKISSNILTASPSTFKFPGHDDYEVKVTMQLTPLSGDVVELVTYVISGILTFYVSGDSGSSYEAYGNLHVDIGSRSENENIELWDRGRKNYIQVKNGHSYDVDLGKHEFQETPDFVESSQTSSVVTLHGNVKESDNNPDDDVGNYEGETMKPSDLFGNDFSRKFNGVSDYYAKVTLRIERKASIEHPNARNDGKKEEL